MSQNILEVKDLKVEFDIGKNRLVAVDNSNFQVKHGKTTGLVGESGCGKSVSAFSILRLIPNPPGHITNGQILFNNEDLLKLSISEMRRIRGKEIAMIFQEPMTALNPVYTIQKQMGEIYKLHFDYSKSTIIEKSIEMLKLVGIPSPERRIKDYPHQLSGGMRQRVMIAMALSCSPKVLIADEPTTALDVTIQAQILDLINELKERTNMATVFITHDLGVVAEMCDDVIVMYAGKIVEHASVFDLFDAPLHPYTKGLMDSIPKPGFTKDKKLPTIEGMVPDLLSPPKGCRFADRCFKADKICRNEEPPLRVIANSNGRKVACHFPLS